MKTLWSSPFVGPARSDEARQLLRVPTALSCVLSYGALLKHTSGIVRDMHKDGARVQPACDPSLIKGNVELLIGGDRFLAKVAWKRGSELGLQFLVNLSDEHHEAVHRLRATLAAMKREQR